MNNSWAVVVVHGVGPTQPGDTLDQVLPTLLDVEPSLSLKGSREIRLLPEPGTEDAAKLSVFPMHMQKLTATSNGVTSECVLAEVHWADLAGNDKGIFSLVYQFITLVFSLRYVVDQAAASVRGWPRFVIRFMAYCCTFWMIAGIAALNLCMLYFMAAFIFFKKVALFGDQLEIAISGTGVCLAAIAWIMVRKWNKSANWQLTMFGAFIFSLIFFLAGIGGLFDKPTFNASHIGKQTEQVLKTAELKLAHVEKSQSQLSSEGGDKLSGKQGTSSASGNYAKFSPLLLSTLAGIQYAFFLLILGMLLLSFFWMACFLLMASSRPSLIAALGALCLQIGLWVVLVPAIAYMVIKYVIDGGEYEVLLKVVWQEFTIDLFFGLLVVAAAVVVYLVRLIYMKAFSAQRLPRLLIHPVIALTLITASLVGSMSYAIPVIYRSFQHSVWVGFLAPIALFIEAHRELIQHSFLATISTPLLGVIAILWWRGNNELKAGLHILADITQHFHRKTVFSIRETWTRKSFDPRICDIQQHIEGRMIRILKEVLGKKEYQKLTILAHSQGTVTAINVLSRSDTQRLLVDGGVHETWLVTLGSPFTHLYQHYFPDRYPSLAVKQDEFNQAGWHSLRHTVKKWLNVFRVDDWVGTDINGLTEFPTNYCIGPGGHTGYWRQREVIHHIKHMLPH